MNKKVVVFPALALGIAALACAQSTPPAAAPAPAPRTAPSGPAPTKIAIINIQRAILTTHDGQKAANELQTKFAPRRSTLEKKQADIQALQDQLRKGSATMSEEAKAKLERDIDTNTKSFQREGQDLNEDVDQENGRLMNDLGGKIMTVIEQYGTQNGFAVVLDVSSQQTPVLWAAASTDITPDIIRLYDQAHPGTDAPAARPAAAAPKPPAAAAPKKP